MGIMEMLAELDDMEEELPVEEATAEPELPEEQPVQEPEQEEILRRKKEAPPEQPQSPEPPVLPDAEDSMAAGVPRRRSLRPEAVMGIVALFAAALLVAMVVLCWPYFQKPEDEDPEALLQQYQQNYEPYLVTEAPEQTFLEPTVSETEPENPTIPPEPNPYDRYDFQYNRHNYLLLQNLKSYPGVDVSAYQGDIDWKKVKASGIDFAIIRLGYRGYESGKLVEDDYAKKNLQEAAEAGLKVGAYFFSQALNVKEVNQEIDFILEILDGQKLDMPLVLDWEIPASSARTARMDIRTLTDIQLHFCDTVAEMGFQPMIYFNWYQSEHLYYLSELEDYPFWLALYQDRMTYPWKIEMWQYTDKGRVPGIYGDVDLNVYMPD